MAETLRGVVGGGLRLRVGSFSNILHCRDVRLLNPLGKYCDVFFLFVDRRQIKQEWYYLFERRNDIVGFEILFNRAPFNLKFEKTIIGNKSVGV